VPDQGENRPVDLAAVTEVLPGLLPLACVRVKLTAFDDNETVIESFSTAFKLIVLAPEFSTCAWAAAANTMTRNITVASLASICGLCLIA